MIMGTSAVGINRSTKKNVDTPCKICNALSSKTFQTFQSMTSNEVAAVFDTLVLARKGHRTSRTEGAYSSDHGVK